MDVVQVTPNFKSDSVTGNLTGHEKVAVRFAAAALVLIALFSAAIFCFWWRHVGAVPMPALDMVPIAEQAQAVTHYKELSDVPQERAEKIFDIVVSRTFLPLLSTLVGFLLGRRSMKN